MLAYLLSNRLIRGKQDQDYMRMRVDLADGHRIYVDGNGCVRFGNKDYYMRPWAFLRLYNLMGGGR